MIALTPRELGKLKQIVDEKFYGLACPGSTMDPHWLSRRLDSWRELLKERHIEYQGRLMSIIVDDGPDEVRVEDPAGNVLKLTADQAKKILVLGL